MGSGPGGMIWAGVAALVLGTAGVGTAYAQQPLSPVIAASRSEGGPEAFVFQCLMGATNARGAFIGYEAAGPQIQTYSEVRWFNLEGEHGTGPSQSAVPMEEPCDWAYITGAVLPTDEPGDYVGVAGGGPVLPNVLRLHSPSSQTYRTAAADYFRSIGHYTKAVTLTQVIRTDLNGDGVEEVLITVRDDADGIPTTVDAGDHSAILLRRVVNGGVETVLVDGEFYSAHEDFGAPTTYNIMAIADLNGDGLMEIVATADYYEGSSFVAYSMRGGVPTQVLTCGCGA